MHSCQNNRHSLTSLRTQSTFHNATTGYLTKWRLRNQHQNSTLIAHHCPDLGIAIFNQSEARSRSEQWCVWWWYGISALVLPMLFGGEMSGGITKCWLISQAILLLSLSKLTCNKSYQCTWEVCQALKKLKLPSTTPWATLSFFIASCEHQLPDGFMLSVYLFLIMPSDHC